MATAAQVQQHKKVQAVLVDAAEVELAKFWKRLTFDNPAAARDALLDFMPALVEKYGKAAGVAAAQFYDTVRDEADTNRKFQAIVADIDREPVIEGTRRLAGELFGDDPTSIIAGLNAIVDKHVKQAGRDTITGSAARDPHRPRYARVPVGSDTCEWCLMLASRGFVYASEDTAAGNKYHHHCDCQPVPEFSDHPALDGYDPDALYAAYQALSAA